MYVNKCIKCGKEFETKNPKRVICPDCLYSDKKYTEELSAEAAKAAPQGLEDKTERNSYSFGSSSDGAQNTEQHTYKGSGRFQKTDYEPRPNYRYNNHGFAPRDNRQRPNYQAGRQEFGRQGQNFQNTGFQRPYNKFAQGAKPGGFAPRRPNAPGGFGNRPQRPGRPKPKRQKQLLISREQLEQIEILYKKALPLPNPDVHEIIGQAVQIEPRKVFFGINLIRQKLMLPKLPFPKRKLAVSPDQMFAVKNLYEPLLPLPPIGCHKIIAAQLRMDEWRVHVAIGLIRKQMGLDRWNQGREDLPPGYRKSESQETAAEVSSENSVKSEKSEKAEKAEKTEKKETKKQPQAAQLSLNELPPVQEQLD